MSVQKAASLVKHDEPKVTFALRPDGVAVITMNDTRETLNTITPRFGEDLRDAFERVARDPAVVAAVVTSAKRDFLVGANIDAIRAVTLASEAERMSALFASILRTMSDGEKPVVAAVNGKALGGGFEVALACRAIVAADDAAFGLPEVQLGLVAAANGMERIAERAGLAVALDVSLTGRTLRAKKALAMGLVDAVCPAAVLFDVAVARAKALAEGKSPARRAPSPKDALTRAALEKNPVGRAVILRKARAETRKKTRGNYPATERILDVLEAWSKRGFDAAAAVESKAFGELVVSEAAHRLIDVFFAQTALKKDTGVDDPSVVASQVEHVGVIGAGLMGAGIAYVSANAGIGVRLKDKDDASVGRGMKSVKDLLDARVAKRSLGAEERDQIFARVGGTSDMSGFKHADVVVEAVFEDLALKRRVLADVEAATGEACIFASNTSSIPIAQIAESATRPENVVGMHYFSPVDKMPLLEVVRAPRTSPRAVATCVSLGKKQGKTVIVVNDGPGFYTSRVLAPYMNEAAQLVAEGVPIDAVDDAMVAWGFPVGPIQLLDEVGIDVAAHVGPILRAAFGERMAPPPVMEALAKDDRKGRKNGRGLYRYDAHAVKRGARQVDPTAYAALGVEPKAKLPLEDIQMRCALVFVNEALRCLEEKIVRSARDADVGAVFGLGFPPFRGGPMRYADTLGAAELLRRLRAYEDRFGARFTPAPIVIELEKRGKRLF